MHAAGEWDAFMGSLRTTLPTTFRINGSGKFAEDLRNQLETDFLASFTQGPVKVRRWGALLLCGLCSNTRSMCGCNHQP
jgi:hypothetical protein